MEGAIMLNTELCTVKQEPEEWTVKQEQQVVADKEQVASVWVKQEDNQLSEECYVNEEISRDLVEVKLELQEVEYSCPSLDNFRTDQIAIEEGPETYDALMRCSSFGTEQLLMPSGEECGSTTRSNYTGEGAYQCEICSRTFIKRGNLERHLLTHTGDNPYQCKSCGKIFCDGRALKRHLWSHTDQLPFQCSTCSKSFTDKSNLTKHLRTHTGEKPYPCDICSKTFRVKSHLIGHFSTHTGDKPYQCNGCNKVFSLRSSLKRHIRTHFDELSFQCSACSKSFRDKSNLIKHIRTHMGEKKRRIESSGPVYVDWRPSPNSKKC